jgi:Amt family ammonium transporter
MLAGVFATAAIGGSSGRIEGHPQQLPTQLYGVNDRDISQHGEASQ